MKSKYFTQEKQEKALKWLDDKWNKEKRKCEICDEDEWSFCHELVTPLPFIASNISHCREAFPHFLITCNSCGNAKMFNAIIIGIVPRSEPKDS